MRRRRRGATLLAHVLLAAATLVVVFPMLYAVQVSTLEFQDVFVFPPKLLPGTAFADNLRRAWEKVHLGRLLANSAGRLRGRPRRPRTPAAAPGRRCTGAGSSPPRRASPWSPPSARSCSP